MASGSSKANISTVHGDNKSITTMSNVSKVFAGDKNNANSLMTIKKTFRDIIEETPGLDDAANYLFQSLLDDAVVGIFLEIHHLRKTGNLAALDGLPEDDAEASFRIVDMPNYNIFGISTKKPMDCTCPHCGRPVSASRFAPHLAKCMGLGRTAPRISRRLATKEGTSASSSSSSSYLHPNMGSDYEYDDVDWPSEKRRKKSQNSQNNGSKKNNGKTC